MKKSFATALFLIILISGCSQPKLPEQITNLAGGEQSSFDINGGGYVSEMTTDADGFVRFPGEPTRNTTKYVVIEDICGQFTAKFMENVTGHKITKAENPYQEIGSIYTCHYTYEGNTNPDILLVLNYLEFANQKKGHEILGRRTEESTVIPMRNLVVYQENGQINEIYLVLGDNKFISLNRGAGTKVTNDEVLTIATKMGMKMANYE